MGHDGGKTPATLLVGKLMPAQAMPFIVVIPVLIGMPDLDHHIRERLALTVEHEARQGQGAAACCLPRQVVFQRSLRRIEWPLRLRRREVLPPAAGRRRLEKRRGCRLCPFKGSARADGNVRMEARTERRVG